MTQQSPTTLALNATIPLPGAAAVDAGLVAETVADVNAAWERGGLATSRAIAAIVLDKMFRDDINHFLDGFSEHASFAALSDAPKLRVGKAALWYAVAIEENFALLGSSADGLTVSHHRRLVHVADVEARKALAERVVAEALTVAGLETAIAAALPPPPPGARPMGRPRLPEPVKRFTKIQSAINKLDMAAVDDLTSDDAQLLIDKATIARTALDAWITALRGRVAG